MAIGDPFGTTYEGARQGLGTIGEAILGIAGLYAQRKQREREMQMEEASKRGLLDVEYGLRGIEAERGRGFEKEKLGLEYELRGTESEKERLFKERTMEMEKQQKKTDLLATLATKGLITATTLPKEPETVEDFQSLATQSGRQLAARNPEVARRLLEASGIKIPKRPKTFPIEGLGEFYQTGVGRNIADVSDLTSEQQLQGRALARKIYGVRGAEFGLPAVYEEMRTGKSLDQIEDSLRYAGQSKEFAGSIRDATQTIMIDAGNEQAQRAMDYIDDYVSRGDIEGVKSQLKRLSIQKAPASDKTLIVSKERTIKLLDEIQDDLNNLEKIGIDTNIFSGTEEQVANKIGLVVHPEAKTIAVKIQAAVQNYRRGMTGVAFGMIENKEYKNMFPSMKNTDRLNSAIISGLREAFTGDLDNFYSLSMGEENYKKLFGERKFGKAQPTQKQTQDIKEGQTATNPKTGEKMIYRGGKWQKI